MEPLVVDASAILAILLEEDDAEGFAALLESARVCWISPVQYLEVAMVLESRNNPVISRAFDNLLRAGGVAIVPIDAEQAVLARAAYRDFGKGRHKAGLNMGDCFAYALALQKDAPILAKGPEFGRTDLVLRQPVPGS